MPDEERKNPKMENGRYVTYREFVSWAGKMEAVQQSLKDISDRLTKIEQDLHVLNQKVDSLGQMQWELNNVREAARRTERKVTELEESAMSSQKRIVQLQNTLRTERSIWEKLVSLVWLPIIGWLLGLTALFLKHIK